jgi:limonene-1,2-epoxide hydrolase
MDTTTEQPASMTPKELISKWVELFNRKDINGLTELYAEDAINHQVVTDPLVGREAIRKMLETEMARAEMVCMVENIFQEGEWGILEWKDPLGLRGCGFFKIQNDRIVFQRGYFDQLSFLKQQGLPLP